MLGPAEELEIDRLADHRRHVGIGHRRRPCLGPVDQALFEPVQCLFPGHRHRVEIEKLHRDAAKLRAGDAVLGAEEFLELGHGGLFGKVVAQLDAAQFAMREQEFQPVPLFQRLAQDALRFRRIEEMVLRRTAREHIGIIEHVEIGRATGRVLRRGGIHVDDAGLGFLDTVKLAANLVIADEFYPDFALGPLLQIAGEFQNAGAFDQQVARVEAGRAQFQRVLGLFRKAFLIGAFGSAREGWQADRPRQRARAQDHG